MITFYTETLKTTDLSHSLFIMFKFLLYCRHNHNYLMHSSKSLSSSSSSSSSAFSYFCLHHHFSCRCLHHNHHQ